jgi:hypothetical protein
MDGPNFEEMNGRQSPNSNQESTIPNEAHTPEVATPTKCFAQSDLGRHSQRGTIVCACAGCGSKCVE